MVNKRLNGLLFYLGRDRKAGLPVPARVLREKSQVTEFIKAGEGPGEDGPCGRWRDEKTGMERHVETTEDSPGGHAENRASQNKTQMASNRAFIWY